MSGNSPNLLFGFPWKQKVEQKEVEEEEEGLTVCVSPTTFRSSLDIRTRLGASPCLVLSLLLTVSITWRASRVSLLRSLTTE